MPIFIAFYFSPIASIKDIDYRQSELLHGMLCTNKRQLTLLEWTCLVLEPKQDGNKNDT